MRLNGYRCDGCGKEVLARTLPHNSGLQLDLPASWFLVYQTGQELQFCSQACISKYFLEQAKKEQPS